MIGTDLVVSASKEVRGLISSKNTFAIINDNETPLQAFHDTEDIDDEIKNIRWIKNMNSRGYSYYKIANMLNEKDILSSLDSFSSTK